MPYAAVLPRFPTCDREMKNGLPISRRPFSSKSCKPGSVPRRSGVPVIYLRRRSPAASSNLPPDIGRATLLLSVYMVLQPAGRTAGRHRCLRGGLLPRLFTLTLAGGSFLLRLPCPHGHQAVNLRGALCCPDFPPPACAGGDKADLHNKGSKDIPNEGACAEFFPPMQP